MKINNQRGELVTIAAVTLAIILGLVFIPNDLSKATGLQNKQNKIVQTQTEKIELLRDSDGKPIRGEDGGYIVKRMTKTSDSDQQQQVSVWERLTALPVLWLFLMILGGFFPVVGAIMAKINGALKRKFKELTAHHKELEGEVKIIVRAIDEAFATIPMTLAGEQLPGEIDRAELSKKIADGMLNVLSTKMDQSTKDLVRELRAA